VSTSRRERGGYGTHGFYNYKDIVQPYQNDIILPDDVVTFVDTDYYVDLNEYAGHDLVIFTFDPKELSGTYGEGFFHYFAKDRVRFRVNGGAVYEHQVWFLDRDMVTLHRRCYTYVYRVDRHIVTNNHSLVFLTLLATMFNPLNITALCLGLDDASITRVELVETKTYLIRHCYKPLPHYQILHKHSMNSYSILCSIFHTLLNNYERRAKLDPGEVKQYFTVDSNIRIKPEQCFFLHAAIVSGEFSNNNLPATTLGAVSTDYHVIATSQNDRLRDKQPKTSSSIIAPPLATNVSVPVAINEGTNVKAVEDRLLTQLNDVTPENVEIYWQAFKKLLLKGRISVPYSHAEVLDQQTRPLQRIRNARNAYRPYNSKKVCSTFLKKEPCKVKIESGITTVSTPRIVSTYEPTQCLQLATYTYPLVEEILKTTHWYQSCSTPEKLEKAITHLLRFKNARISANDGVKQDAHTTHDWRKRMADILVTYFPGNKDHIHKLMQYDSPEFSITEFDQLFEPGFSVRSGSSLTTILNSLNMAWMAFVHFMRKKFPDEKAWSLIGLKAGDDSVDMDTYEEMCKTYESFGYKITGVNYHHRENETLEFLGRKFFMYNGRLCSMCDLNRFVAKFHLSDIGNKDPDQALANKVYGYEVTDPKTPIIQHLVSLLKRLGYKKDDNVTSISYAHLPGTFTNIAPESINNLIAAKTLNLPLNSLMESISIIDSATRLQDVLEAIYNGPKPVLPEVIAVESAVVGDRKLIRLSNKNINNNKLLIGSNGKSKKARNKPKTKTPYSGRSVTGSHVHGKGIKSSRETTGGC